MVAVQEQEKVVLDIVVVVGLGLGECGFEWFEGLVELLVCF